MESFNRQSVLAFWCFIILLFSPSLLAEVTLSGSEDLVH